MRVASARSVRVFSELNPELCDIEAVVTGHHRLLRGLTSDTDIMTCHMETWETRAQPGNTVGGERQFKTHVIVLVFVLQHFR